MTCPMCNGKTKVVDSVATDITVIRRRKCIACNHSFYSEEISHDNDDELRHTFSQIKNDKCSYENNKLRFIKEMIGGDNR